MNQVIALLRSIQFLRILQEYFSLVFLYFLAEFQKFVEKFWEGSRLEFRCVARGGVTQPPPRHFEIRETREGSPHIVFPICPPEEPVCPPVLRFLATRLLEFLFCQPSTSHSTQIWTTMSNLENWKICEKSVGFKKFARTMCFHTQEVKIREKCQLIAYHMGYKAVQKLSWHISSCWVKE